MRLVVVSFICALTVSVKPSLLLNRPLQNKHASRFLPAKARAVIKTGVDNIRAEFRKNNENFSSEDFGKYYEYFFEAFVSAAQVSSDKKAIVSAALRDVRSKIEESGSGRKPSTDFWINLEDDLGELLKGSKNITSGLASSFGGRQKPGLSQNAIATLSNGVSNISSNISEFFQHPYETLYEPLVAIGGYAGFSAVHVYMYFHDLVTNNLGQFIGK